ncbi:hypothetical protein A2U01_0059149, partial [Trifolium medium]|nr:hypothetical protein [Trifolium medium]
MVVRFGVLSSVMVAGDAVFRRVWWFGTDPEVLCGLDVAVVRFIGVVVVAGGSDVV